MSKFKSTLLASTVPTATPQPPPPLEQSHETSLSGPAAKPAIAASSAPRAHRRAHAHSHERDDDGGGDDDDGASRPRDHHGDRTMPPPASFSLAELPDDALLRERDVAAVLRVAVATVETWRRRGHPLKWVVIGGGFIRYRAGDLRQFLANDQPRRRGRPATKPDTAAAQRRPRGRPRKPPAQHTKTAEIQDAAPAPRRRRAPAASGR